MQDLKEQKEMLEIFNIKGYRLLMVKKQKNKNSQLKITDTVLNSLNVLPCFEDYMDGTTKN